MAAEAILEDESVALWREYRATRDVGLRNSLVLRHMGLVYQIANRYAPLARDSADDLVQEGCLGLIRAIERFQPDYGVQFSTYAYPVISGTIKNYLRERRRLLGRARWSGTDRGGLELSADGEELVPPESLEDLAGQVEEDFADQLVDRLVAGNLLRRLPRLERQIIKHFFYEDLTQREVARLVARSTSRISRLLRRALERVRLLLVEIQEEEGRLVYPSEAVPQLIVPSVVDPETKLFSSRHLLRSLHREMARARALRAPLSLALVRPEAPSGPVTAASLAEAARHIYQQVRVLDYVFRAGPAELALIFSLPPRETGLICQRLQETATSISLRCAIATHPHDGDSASALLEAGYRHLDRVGATHSLA